MQQPGGARVDVQISALSGEIEVTSIIEKYPVPELEVIGQRDVLFPALDGPSDKDIARVLDPTQEWHRYAWGSCEMQRMVMDGIPEVVKETHASLAEALAKTDSDVCVVDEQLRTVQVEYVTHVASLSTLRVQETELLQKGEQKAIATKCKQLRTEITHEAVVAIGDSIKRFPWMRRLGYNKRYNPTFGGRRYKVARFSSCITVDSFGN